MEYIKFENGSEIKTIDGVKQSNAPMMIYSINLAKPDITDYSCISYYCTKCKTVFDVQHYPKNMQMCVDLHTECPECGTRFKGWVQNI